VQNIILRIGGLEPLGNCYNLPLPEAFALHHLAFAIAESFALAPALILRLGCCSTFQPFRIPAHRAVADALIAARCAGLIRRFAGRSAEVAFSAGAPRIASNSAWSFSIRSVMSAARRRSAEERSLNVFILAVLLRANFSQAHRAACKETEVSGGVQRSARPLPAGAWIVLHG